MTYETWAMRQLRERPRCRVEGSMRCIPLINDPICRACYESDIERGPDDQPED